MTKEEWYDMDYFLSQFMLKLEVESRKKLKNKMEEDKKKMKKKNKFKRNKKILKRNIIKSE